MDRTRRQITKITRVATRYAAETLRKRGIGSAEYECLHIIRKNEGINQEQIGEILNVDKAAVSRMIQNLEKKGFAIRIKDSEDKRVNKIYPTDRSLAIKFDETDAQSLFYEWLTEDLPPDEIDLFIDVLEKLYIKSKNERIISFKNISDWVEKRRENQV